MCNRFSEEALARLREQVKKTLTPYRFLHTVGVEEMVARLAAIYLPEKAPMLRAAALLHDITKEVPLEEQREIIAAHGLALRADEAASPKILHGITAALTIPAAYPAFADTELISAVRWHTTGRAGMTATEALLYLADYIEEGRQFSDCVLLRNLFFDAAPEKMEKAARERHLWAVILKSLDLTLASLAAEGAPVCLDTLAAREAIAFGYCKETHPLERM